MSLFQSSSSPDVNNSINLLLKLAPSVSIEPAEDITSDTKRHGKGTMTASEMGRLGGRARKAQMAKKFGDARKGYSIMGSMPKKPRQDGNNNAG